MFAILLSSLKYAKVDMMLFQNHAKYVSTYNKLVVGMIIEYLAISGFWRDISSHALFGQSIYASNTFFEFWDPQTHKELRFFIGSLLLIFVTLMMFLDLVLKFISEIAVEFFMAKQFKIKDKILLADVDYYIRVLGSLLLMFLLLSLSFSNLGTRYHQEQYDDINEAMAIVGQTDDLTGLIVVNSWWLTGGYTYLHRNDSITVRYYNFRQNTEAKLNSEVSSFRFQLNFWEELNYIIVPKFQRNNSFSALTDILLEFDYFLINVVGGSAEIWKINGLHESILS